MLTDLCPDVAVPKGAARWIGSVQHRMAKAGEHRRASAVDLAVAAAAAHHGPTSSTAMPATARSPRHATDPNAHGVRDVLP
ncbi:hypothetical protein RGF97_19270 [Streptomyces roseicoloratus]|uniref:Uncharacterized protein n=1 Tax=Streptomyces roseicoloratus TaxID=2508722 RepID=A0ABY9RWK3_9ACTN|nr:hypothetical protein [Streptomyces roseicoloratus]WMX46552.1 hypothetical protein RGF97_19270 [Streptomyces roseicoloratus]